MAQQKITFSGKTLEFRSKKYIWNIVRTIITHYMGNPLSRTADISYEIRIKTSKSISKVALLGFSCKYISSKTIEWNEKTIKFD